MAWHHYVKPIPDVETRVDGGLGGGGGLGSLGGGRGSVVTTTTPVLERVLHLDPVLHGGGFPAKAVSFGVGQEGVWFDPLV